jgi:PHD/YefM family antitoxin component YafN of YafNO toxin-antitoxin module
MLLMIGLNLRVFFGNSGNQRAVLQDPQSYEAMRSALGLLKLIAEGEDDLRAGRSRSQDEVFKRVARTLGKK